MARIAAALLTVALLATFGLAARPDKVFAGVPARPEEAAICGDLLLQLKRKPAKLDFLGCRVDKAYGLRALIADYRVEGRYAEPVERYLVETVDMPALRFICCGWDSAGDTSRDGWLKDGPTSYQISMVSGETVLNTREDWPRIPWFQVTVTRYLEEP